MSTINQPQVPTLREDTPASSDLGMVVRPVTSSALPMPVTLSNVDAFGRYRVSQPTTIFDSQQIVDSQPFFWDDVQTSGAGTSSTFNTNQASTTIAVSATTAGTRVRQTKLSFYYQPGKSQTFLMTFVLGSAATGINRQVGQFNANNGIFLQQTSAGLAFVVRSSTSGSPVDTVIPQASWNLDKLNGTGPSGVTFDPTKIQILSVSYEWLGAGSIFLGFFFQGLLVQAHRIDNSNTISLAYMGVPDLPLRYSINNDGSGPASSLVHICTTVISEGGREDSGVRYSIDRYATGMQTLNNADLYPVISIRFRTGYTYSTVGPTAISMLNTTNSAFLWRLVFNPTVVGTALSFATINANSAIEADVTSTNATTITPGTGTTIASGYGAANLTVSIALPESVRLGTTIAGVSDIAVLAITRITGTTETFFGSLSYRELR